MKNRKADFLFKIICWMDNWSWRSIKSSEKWLGITTISHILQFCIHYCKDRHGSWQCNGGNVRYLILIILSVFLANMKTLFNIATFQAQFDDKNLRKDAGINENHPPKLTEILFRKKFSSWIQVQGWRHNKAVPEQKTRSKIAGTRGWRPLVKSVVKGTSDSSI